MIKFISSAFKFINTSLDELTKSAEMSSAKFLERAKEDDRKKQIELRKRRERMLLAYAEKDNEEKIK